MLEHNNQVQHLKRVCYLELYPHCFSQQAAVFGRLMQILRGLYMMHFPFMSFNQHNVFTKSKNKETKTKLDRHLSLLI